MQQLAPGRICWTLVFAIALLPCALGLAQDGSEEAEDSSAVDDTETIALLDDDGRLVQFERDIAPILRKHCLECHGPKDAKNDFRVDDPDVLMDYIEPEDAESSPMYADYLTIDDQDMLMPPATHGGPLSVGEIALIRVWIDEGAHWTDGYDFSQETELEVPPPPPPKAPKTLGERLWVAAGFLHPATVHFPIALLVLGAGFVVLGWKWPSLGTQIPLACLLLGALSAIAATAMGWSFAPEQGYGSNYSIFEWGREVDTHRWSGLVVSIVSSLVAIIALIALWKDSDKLRTTWKVGLLVCAAMVGAVGHQGGEMRYGSDFYPRAWRILTGTPDPDVVQATEQAISPIESTAGVPAADSSS